MSLFFLYQAFSIFSFHVDPMANVSRMFGFVMVMKNVWMVQMRKNVKYERAHRISYGVAQVGVYPNHGNAMVIEIVAMERMSQPTAQILSIMPVSLLISSAKIISEYRPYGM